MKVVYSVVLKWTDMIDMIWHTPEKLQAKLQASQKVRDNWSLHMISMRPLERIFWEKSIVFNETLLLKSDASHLYNT